jgi:O-antigen/teichoic acid export membrane protein
VLSGDDPSGAEPELSGVEVRRRAKRSVVLLGARSVVLRVVQIAGLLILGRLLVPADFGAFAFAMVFAAVVTIAAEAGLGATLIRQPKAPDRRDLASLLAFQLAVATVLAVAIASTAIWFGTTGAVIAVLVSSLPIVALRTPGIILAERRLEYRPIVYAEVADTLSFYTWAVTAALLGWGVWSLASAAIPRAVAGTLVLLAAVPESRMVPRLSWRRIRRLLGFGIRLQAIDLATTAREHGLNSGIAAISGLATLGTWNYANRIMQVPGTLFSVLWRVSFPAMSQLVNARENMAPLIERGVALTAVATGVMLVPLAATTPVLVVEVLGERWRDVGDVVPLACLAMMISGPISVSVAGYLHATGDARTPLRATIVHTVAFMLVALVLLRPLGLAAVALGWITAAVIDTVILGRRAAATSGAALARPLAIPALVATLAGGLGLALAGDTVSSALLAGALAEAVFVAGLSILAWPSVVDLVRTIFAGLRRSQR